LEQNIQKGQFEDDKIQEIKEHIREVRHQDSVLMIKERYDTRNDYVF
jgi:hypothetical protein